VCYQQLPLFGSSGKRKAWVLPVCKHQTSSRVVDPELGLRMDFFRVEIVAESGEAGDETAILNLPDQ
jgi:hypothetical protein